MALKLLFWERFFRPHSQNAKRLCRKAVNSQIDKISDGFWCLFGSKYMTRRLLVKEVWVGMLVLACVRMSSKLKKHNSKWFLHPSGPFRCPSSCCLSCMELRDMQHSLPYQRLAQALSASQTKFANRQKDCIILTYCFGVTVKCLFVCFLCVEKSVQKR